MKTKSLLLASALLMSASTFAQKNIFKGVVLDDQGEPVIGATIQVKGNKGTGTITDLDGNFSIETDASQPLVITYVGYQNVEVKPSANMRITLKQDDKTLDEVVVVGYGTQKKSVVTASIAKIGADELEKLSLCVWMLLSRDWYLVYRLLLPVVSLVLAARFAYVVRVP